jgi:UDP-N-acetylmuramate--alanine ligase
MSEQGLGRTRRVHLVGIGGIGMSGIAELLVRMGYEVSGSDSVRSAVTDRLEHLGARVFEGHAASQVGPADVVVASSAIRSDNPELAEARGRRIPIIPRGEMLAELMRLRFGIAVAGAHGKTTTSSMVAVMLERAGFDPTAVIGGYLEAFGSSARLGGSHYFVAEADESDRSFLRLSPSIAVITNIDREHMENYRDFDDLLDGFADFANKVPFYGAVVACADDAHVRAVLPRIARRVISYGLESADADLVAGDVVVDEAGGRCRVYHRPNGAVGKGELGEIRLMVPGRHNLLNALAAVAVGLELAIPFDRIADALSAFRGAERRFQHVGAGAGVAVVDDYGHHPTEIAAVLAAARTAARGRVIVAFQPHRFTRTQALFDDFARVLAGADVTILTGIYAASEDPIPGVTAVALAAAVRRAGGDDVHYAERLEDVAEIAARLARPGDLVLTMGAGSIGSVGPRIVDRLRARDRHE